MIYPCKRFRDQSEVAHTIEQLHQPIDGGPKEIGRLRSGMTWGARLTRRIRTPTFTLSVQSISVCKERASHHACLAVGW